MNPLLLLALTATVQAQSRGAVPETNVQTWSPRVEYGGMLWTNDGRVPQPGYFNVGLISSYQRGPLVYEYGDGSVSTIVEDAVQADVVGSFVVGPARLGLDLPVHLFAAGDALQATAGTGDLVVDGKVRVLDDKLAPIGLALGTRLALPTASVKAPLGDDGLGWELSAMAHRSFGSTMIALNLANRLRPATTLENGTLGSAFLVRLGAQHELTRHAGISADLGTDFIYGADGLGVPVQGILGGWGRIGGFMTMRAGVGTGFTRAVGTPPLRAIFGVTYEPRPAVDSDEDTLMDDVDDCPFIAEDVDGFQDDDGCPDPDNDRDGIIDAEDTCDNDPEDMDGYVDYDGCPDDKTMGRLRFVDAEGNLVSRVSAYIILGEEEQLAGNDAELELDPGTYSLEAAAPGFATLKAQFTAVSSEAANYTFTLEPPDTGLRITVLDMKGVPIEDAFWWTDDREITTIVPGAEFELPPGHVDVFLGADDYAMLLMPVDIEEDRVTDLRVTMVPSKVEVTDSRINLKEKVFFDTGKADIRSESFAMLDEVAAVLRGNPQIVKIRIEGHTDSRGSADANRKLSQDRADAVRGYLEAKGVHPDRMQAVGFGEDHPLDEADTEAAWEVNRRVDIFILERKDE